MPGFASPADDSAIADPAASTTAAGQGQTRPLRPTAQRSAEQLAEIRISLLAATNAGDDHHLRRQHAHHAAGMAAGIILRKDSTDEQRRTAGSYLSQAVTMRDGPGKAR